MKNNILKLFIKDEKGNILILLGFFIFSLLIGVGLAVDFGKAQVRARPDAGAGGFGSVSGGTGI